MKKILLSAFLVFVGTLAFSQVTISADTAYYSYFPKDSQDHHEKVTFTNNSAVDSVNITWQKTSENLLSGWSIGGICDKVTCYSNPSGAHSFGLAAGKSAIFYVGMVVDQEAANGCSSATVKVTDDLSTTVQYVSFKYCSWPLAVKNYESANIVNIYPNPASSFVNITLNEKSIRTINVLNVIGKKIAQFSVEPTRSNTMRVPLDNVSDGIYMLQFSDASGKLLGVRRVTKN